MIGEDAYFDAAASDADKIQELLEFVAWCASEGNQAGTIASKLSAVLHFHRINLQMELPTSSPLIKRALKGVTRSHVAAGTPKRVRRPISWDSLLEGQGLALSWGPGGRVLWLSLALGYFFVARSDEIFASPAGAVHPVHCLTRRDVALYKGERRLASLQWHQATSIEVRFRGHKGDQAQQGSVIVRTRDDASGTRSGVGAGGGAVALMVELLSVYPTMPESAPLSSYRCGNEVRVWRYPEALAALRQVAARAGHDPSEVGLHSLRIGAATTLAAGGDVSQRVIQREGRWKSSESSKVYTRNNPEDAGIVSRKLAETGKIGQRQPGQGTVWSRTP